MQHIPSCFKSPCLIIVATFWSSCGSPFMSVFMNYVLKIGSLSKYLFNRVKLSKTNEHVSLCTLFIESSTVWILVFPQTQNDHEKSMISIDSRHWGIQDGTTEDTHKRLPNYFRMLQKWWDECAESIEEYYNGRLMLICHSLQ